jgi:V-type H+-transporting ATPase subunit H
MAFVLGSNAFLEEASTKTRNKPVLWEVCYVSLLLNFATVQSHRYANRLSLYDCQGYRIAGLVSAEDVALLKKIDRIPRAKVDMILLSEGQAYALLYLSLLKKLVRLDTIQYILVMVSDALLGAYSLLALIRSGALVLKACIPIQSTRRGSLCLSRPPNRILSYHMVHCSSE